LRHRRQSSVAGFNHAPRCGDIPDGGVHQVTPQRRCQWAREPGSRSQVLSSMFNFSANHLLLLSRMEYRTCAVLLMRDDSTRRVYRLHDFTKSQTPTPGQYYCVSGKVNSADRLYLVIESIKPDTKHGRCSTVPAHADGPGGRSMV